MSFRRTAFERVRATRPPRVPQAGGAMSPYLADRVAELKSWDDVKLLDGGVDRLRKWWRPGLLCIGDAAHAMSPIGGVGINLAVQDAVAAANRLAAPLRAGRAQRRRSQAIQARRTLPVRFTQRFQLMCKINHQPRTRRHAKAQGAAAVQDFGDVSGAAAVFPGVSWRSASGPSTSTRRIIFRTAKLVNWGRQLPFLTDGSLHSNFST